MALKYFSMVVCMYTDSWMYLLLCSIDLMAQLVSHLQSVINYFWENLLISKQTWPNQKLLLKVFFLLKQKKWCFYLKQKVLEVFFIIKSFSLSVFCVYLQYHMIEYLNLTKNDDFIWIYTILLLEWLGLFVI